VLVGMLRLDFAYARLSDAIDSSPIEVVRLAQRRHLAALPQEVGRALSGWLTGNPPTSPIVVPNPFGAGEVSLALLRLGLQDDIGIVVAGSQRADFPTDTERLLMRVAVNQAAMGLQEARRMREQRRAAEEIEQRVVARTRQLTAVNEEFRKEIVERQRAEEQVRQSEARWRALFENSAVGITMMDLSGRFLAANAAYQAMLGYSEAELQALSFMDLTYEDDRAATWGLITELLEAQRPFFVLAQRYWHKDGHIIWGNIHMSLVPGTASIPRCLMAVVEDITERKRAEAALSQAQMELAHVTRVATLGELTASIAHEINQPLAAVVNNASACVRWLAAQNLAEAGRSAALVIADGQRAADIIGRIRALAQKAPPHKDWLDLNTTIQDVIALARSEVRRHGVAVETQLAAEVPRILGDRIQLQQVLLNLIMNAIEAMSGVSVGPRALWVSSEPVAATEVVIAVRDSGPGFNPQHLDRLCEAFYTTKPHGLGLGLAISRRIIEAHGGRLWATANVPHGAVVQFTVPMGSEGGHDGH
jgi:PAS domain S-box-containing protein